jgi:hypothetical protein
MRLLLLLAGLALPITASTTAASAAEPRLRSGHWAFTLTDLDGARRSVESCVRSQADEHAAIGLPDRGALAKGCSVSERVDADQLGGRMSCSGKADLHYRISVGGSATEGIIQSGKAKTVIKGLRSGDCP